MFKKMNYFGRLYRHHAMKLEARQIALKEMKLHIRRVYESRKYLETKQKRGFSELYKELY